MEGSGERSSLPRCRLIEKKRQNKSFLYLRFLAVDLRGMAIREGPSDFRNRISSDLAMVWTDFGACRRIWRIEEGSERKLVILV